MKNIIKVICKFILIITFLNIFAFSVVHVTKGGTKFGIFTNVLKEFSEFPSLVTIVVKETFSFSRLVNIDPKFKPLNNLKYDVFALNASFNNSKWNINLINLKNDSLIHQWFINKENYFTTKDDLYSNNFSIFSHAELWGPILLKDRSIILSTHSTFNLYRLDSNSNIIWHNTDYFVHHSINLDAQENLWACTRKIIKLSPDKNIKYNDEYITKFDTQNGNALFSKSIREILTDNGLGYLAYGLTNRHGADFYDLDLFHLNDIEPALKDGPYWKSGDLLISIRNRSMIFLYRPSSNKIIRIIQGPFFNQHDVDIQSDSTISVFNNNRSNSVPANDTEISKLQQCANPELNKNSQVVEYNFKDSTFSFIYPNQFTANEIYTGSEGLHHVLSNGDMFIESQNEGKIYIFNENEVLLKKYINPIINNQVESPHWVRIYENINF